MKMRKYIYTTEMYYHASERVDTDNKDHLIFSKVEATDVVIDVNVVDKNGNELELGDRVKFPKYGVGTIVSVKHRYIKAMLSDTNPRSSIFRLAVRLDSGPLEPCYPGELEKIFDNQP